MLVFVSHSSLDSAAAQAVVDAIEARGRPCWIASRDVLPGENYQQSIDAAIERSSAMVLIFSRNADNSDEIKKELSLASMKRLPVFPVRIEDLKPSGGLRYELATRQWIDAFRNWDGAMNRLAKQLAGRGVATREQFPGRLTTWSAWLKAGVAAAVLAAVGGGWLLYDANAWRFRFKAAGPVNPETQVTGFDIVVAVGALPKKAEIRRITADRYAEIDEAKNQTDMAVLGRIIYRGCPGPLLHDGGKYIHFPDKQCPAMLFYISNNGRDFGSASRMIDVR